MNFFDYIYVINLDKRKDRWEQIKGELSKLGVADRAIRIPGVDLGNHTGCTASHKKFLDAAIANGRGVSLVLEDDAMVCPDWQKSLISGVAKIPDDWDILYLGYNLDPTSGIPPDFVSRHLLELHGCLTTHMYAVNCNRLDRIKRFRELMETNSNIIQIDMLYLHIALTQGYKTYAIYPMVATQRPGFSDISGFNVSYTLRENVDAVLRGHLRVRPQ